MTMATDVPSDAIQEILNTLPEGLNQFFETFSEPTRTAIMVCLMEGGEMTFSGLQNALDIESNLLSYHLGRLLDESYAERFEPLEGNAVYRPDKTAQAIFEGAALAYMRGGRSKSGHRLRLSEELEEAFSRMVGLDVGEIPNLWSKFPEEPGWAISPEEAQGPDLFVFSAPRATQRWRAWFRESPTEQETMLREIPPIQR